MDTSNNVVKIVYDNSDDKFVVDLIKHELDWRLYDYGEHLENYRLLTTKQLLISDIKNFCRFVQSFFCCPQSSGKNRVLSFLPNLDDLLRKNGYTPYSYIYFRKTAHSIHSLKLFYFKFKVDRVIRRHDFNRMLSNTDIKFINSYIDFLKELIIKYDFKALIVTTDEFFYQRSAIAAFQLLGRPTISFTHGLPGNYVMESDTRADYILTWGNAIRQNYIKIGLNPSKIHVVGNPKYQTSFKDITIHWDDKNILVIPESAFEYHQHTYSQPHFPDRSRMIAYLYEVQYVLMELGYKKARFRPHPSLNWNWFLKYVDMGFYEIDKKNLVESIRMTSMIIGATSSVFLEYMKEGKNYIVYERPRTCSDYPLVPPFNGHDKRIPFASTPDQLMELMRRKPIVDPSVFDDYIQGFDKEKLLSLMKEATCK